MLAESSELTFFSQPRLGTAKGGIIRHTLESQGLSQLRPVMQEGDQAAVIGSEKLPQDQ
jgi:hypothetical protein